MLTWYPLVRDSAYYLLSIIVLILVSLSDIKSCLLVRYLRQLVKRQFVACGRREPFFQNGSHNFDV